MASRSFSSAQWKQVRAALDGGGIRYGLPDRRYGSIFLASFNIRKLGRIGNRRRETWEFLADVCRHFDLLAVQEVMDDLSGLHHLKTLMGPEFDLIVSDKTGAFPGEPGLGERLGFIFNTRLIRRTDVATDITYDRSKVLRTLSQYNDEIHETLAPHAKAFQVYQHKLAEFEAGRLRRRPARPKLKVQMPVFLSFVRAPFCVSFEISGHPGTTPYQFMAVNAHLYFGDFMSDRRQEFDAIMSWLIARVEERDKAYYPNFILLGDLNLDFNNPGSDRARIEKHMKRFNAGFGDEAHVNFPFLDVHPHRDKVFRTNARHTETFDQIGLFFRDERFPTFQENPKMGPEGRYDYGVFDFVQLFSEALHDKPFSLLSKQKQNALLASFEHKVSDHMPLWLRLPLP